MTTHNFETSSYSGRWSNPQAGVATQLLEACMIVDQADGTAVDRADFDAKFEVALRAVRAALKAYCAVGEL